MEGKRTIEFDVDQLHELKAAVAGRVKVLRNEQGRMEKMGLDTGDVDRRIELLKGTDDSVGLAQILSDQIDLFEQGFDAGAAASAPAPPPDDEGEE